MIQNNLALQHTGVKGMRWGVRHDKQPVNEPTKKHKLTTEQKVLIGVSASAVVLAAIGGLYLYKTSSYRTSINVNSLRLGKYKVDEMLQNDSIITKGSNLFRASSEKTLRDGPVYLSTNTADKNRYIHRMSDMHKNLYQMTIKTTADIKIPSEKKQMDMFVDLLTNDLAFSETVTRNPYGISKYVFGDREKAEEFAKNYAYSNFITGMIDYNSKEKNTLSTFADYVKSKGYSALIDVNDIRTTSDNPIIALNKNDLIIDDYKKINAAKKIIAGLQLKNVTVDEFIQKG